MIHLQINPPKWFYGLFLGIMATAAVAVAVEVKAPTLEPLAQRVSTTLDGVVRISGMRTQPSDQGFPIQGMVVGSGFFIDENLILTNNHVVENGESLTITTRNSNKPYNIEIVASDKVSDVAIVKIVDLEFEGFKKHNNPTILELETSDNIVLGEMVYSIGHPWGFAWSISQGIISGTDRRFPDETTPKYYLQTDAKIYSGNSGGPLIDENGKVVGMNTQVYVNAGGSFGFAIPGELLKKIVADLQEKKQVVWPVLGISLGIDTEGNVDIRELTPDRPAKAAGLQSGDVILSMNGTQIHAPDDLLNMLAIMNPKETVTLEIKRANVIKFIPIVLDGKPSDEF